MTTSALVFFALGSLFAALVIVVADRRHRRARCIDGAGCVMPRSARARSSICRRLGYRYPEFEEDERKRLAMLGLPPRRIRS